MVTPLLCMKVKAEGKLYSRNIRQTTRSSGCSFLSCVRMPNNDRKKDNIARGHYDLDDRHVETTFHSQSIFERDATMWRPAMLFMLAEI